MLENSQHEAITALERRIGYSFRDGARLLEALTHASFANEMGAGMPHNERMEFLGDAVLGAVTAHWLFDQYPQRPEGELTQMRSRLVNSTALAGLAREIALGEALLMGVGEERTGGRARRSVLADAMEAVLGAVYLDAGYRGVDEVIRQLFKSRMEALAERGSRDTKSRLQEWAQSSLRITPVYRIVGASGPAHDTSFEAEVQVGTAVVAVGAGRTKQDAEKDAARAALTEIGVEA